MLAVRCGSDTKLYDRTTDEITLDEVERMGFSHRQILEAADNAAWRKRTPDWTMYFMLLEKRPVLDLLIREKHRQTGAA